MFAPTKTGRTREHEPPEMMYGFLHCYYHDIYVIRPVEQELRNTIVWLSWGFDRPPSRDAVDRFLTDLEHVVDEVFNRLVEQDEEFEYENVTVQVEAVDGTRIQKVRVAVDRDTVDPVDAESQVGEKEDE